MKLTTKGRYAVMAMADLASYSKNKPVSLSEISIRQNISLAYLEKLFVNLKDNKLVKSVRGVKGGYALEKPASEIKLSNIDEHGNIQTSEHDSSRLQRLQRPFATFADVNLSWVKN